MSFLGLWLAVGVLGGLGAIARFLIDARTSAGTAGRFPLGTLLVNLSGTIVLGVLVGLAVSGDSYLLSGAAVIGSYTTFSTWMFESHRLAEDGQRWLGGVNLVASLTLGLAALALGQLLGGG